MKSIRIVFKLTPYQLARGLQTIRQLEPTYKLTSLNELVKTIYHDYLAKMTINRLDAIPDQIINEIKSLINNPARTQITLSELMNLKKQDPEPLPKSSHTSKRPHLSDEELTEITKLAAQQKASKFIDQNNTESEISSVSDFSPPKDWME